MKKQNLVQLIDESRKDFLLRVALSYLENNPVKDHQVFYDGAWCDGHCLSDEIRAELSLANNSNDQRRGE